jgi:hypothetical protein
MFSIVEELFMSSGLYREKIGDCEWVLPVAGPPAFTAEDLLKWPNFTTG